MGVGVFALILVRLLDIGAFFKIGVFLKSKHTFQYIGGDFFF